MLRTFRRSYCASRNLSITIRIYRAELSTSARRSKTTGEKKNTNRIHREKMFSKLRSHHSILNIATLQNPHLWLARENKRNKIKFMQNYFGLGAELIWSSKLVKNYIQRERCCYCSTSDPTRWRKSVWIILQIVFLSCKTRFALQSKLSSWTPPLFLSCQDTRLLRRSERKQPIHTPFAAGVWSKLLNLCTHKI